MAVMTYTAAAPMCLSQLPCQITVSLVANAPTARGNPGCHRRSRLDHGRRQALAATDEGLPW